MHGIRSRAGGSGRTDVVTVGETMMMVAPEVPGPMSFASSYRLRPGGAESNVAVHLSRLGHRVTWISRVGSDPFGSLILGYLEDAGVVIDGCEVDEEAPTGTYFKYSTGARTGVLYYRSGSAASRMGPEVLDRVHEAAPAVVHTSGITPALSPSCRELTRRLLAERPAVDALYAFDVNYRPGLWVDGSASEELHRLASLADVVFVGLDEAKALWAVETAEQVRELFFEVPTVVVKNDAGTATAFESSGTYSADPEPVDVVEVVGAGDAFAAGWLSGWLRGAEPEARLALGHRVAAEVLGTPFDDTDLAAVVAELQRESGPERETDFEREAGGSHGSDG